MGALGILVRNRALPGVRCSVLILNPAKVTLLATVIDSAKFRCPKNTYLRHLVEPIDKGLFLG